MIRRTLPYLQRFMKIFIVWKHFGRQKTPRVADMNREIRFWFGHIVAVIRIERRGNGLPFTGYVRQVTVKIEFRLVAALFARTRIA